MPRRPPRAGPWSTSSSCSRQPRTLARADDARDRHFDRKGPLTTEGLEGSGADWHETFNPYIADGDTVVTSPHEVYGPENNDLALQLRKRGVSTVLLPGMSANLCVESHMRALIEQGFEVRVVADATAAANHPEMGDGYAAAITNFKYISSGVLTTEDAIQDLAA